jgi:hypothetical protein
VSERVKYVCLPEPWTAVSTSFCHQVDPLLLLPGYLVVIVFLETVSCADVSRALDVVDIDSAGNVRCLIARPQPKGRGTQPKAGGVATVASPSSSAPTVESLRPKQTAPTGLRSLPLEASPRC